MNGDNTMSAINLNNEIIRNLSENEMVILKYIYHNTNEVSKMDIKSLSNAIPCSSSTIVRFCKKLGFTGFSELKYRIKTDTTLSLPPNDNQAILSLTQVAKRIQTDVKGSLSLVSEESLYNVAKLLLSDDPVYVFMPGGITDTLCHYFTKLFMANGRPNIYKLASSHLAKQKISSLSKNSIMVFISTSGKWEKTIELVKLSNLYGIRIISFSPYTDNELAKYSDYNLRFFSEKRNIGDAEYTSRLAIFFIIHTLVEYYCALKETPANHE